MADERSNASKQVWYYDPNYVPKNTEPAYGRAKSFLYNRLYRSITRHDLKECYKLLRLIPREISLDSYVLFRFILILINSVETTEVNKNFLIYLESFLKRLNLSKPESFIEFLAYFIGHNRIEDAKELFVQRQRSIVNLRHRQVPFVEINVCIYKFFISFIEWNAKADDAKIEIDYSIMGWLVNAMDCIKQLNSNYEYFALAVIKVLLYYGFYKKAYLFASEFQQTNPDNIAAQLLLLKMINLLVQVQEESKKDAQLLQAATISEEDRISSRSSELASINNFQPDETGEQFDLNKIPLDSDRKDILNNLKRLDPKRWEIVELSAITKHIETVQSMMDSLEYLEEARNITRWQSLEELLRSILSSNEEETLTELRTLWQTRYQQFWNIDYFQELVCDQNELIDVIENVISLLSSKFDNSDDIFETILDDDDNETIMDLD